MIKEQAKKIARLFLTEETVGSLFSFLQEAASSSYDYKVAMARRCFNLCAAVLGKNGIYGDIISNQGIFLYAEEMAEYYLRYHELPRILLIDDILLHGRAIANVLYTLEALIMEHLEQLTKFPPRKSRVHIALMSAVDIRVYARVIDGNTVEHSFLSDVESEVELEEKEINQLSRKISFFLLESGIANTSFQLSTSGGRMSEDDLGSDMRNWDKASWTYHGFGGELWFLEKYGITAPIKGDGVVYVYDTYTGLSDLKTCTGLVFLKSISQETLNRIWKHFLLSQEGRVARRISSVLSFDSKYVLEYKAQLLMLLISAFVLKRFWKDFFGDESTEKMIKRSDLWKIAANFGRPEDVYTSIEAFIENPELQQLLDVDTSKHVGQSLVCKRSESSIERLNVFAENIFNEYGLKSEAEARDYGRNLIAYKPFKKDHSMITFSEYEQHMPGTSRDAYSIAAGLLRSGVISMRFFSDVDTKRVQCALKAGELSTHTLPERYQDFIPALACVEKRYWMTSLSKQKAIEEFVDYLWTRRDRIQGLDKDILFDLKQNIFMLLTDTYRAGKNITSWEGINWADREYLTLDWDVFLKTRTEHEECAEMLNSEAWDFLIDKAR